MTTRAIGYIRVSTDDQAEHGAGLDIQRDAIAATCAELNLTLAATFADEGISGKEDMTTRTGLARALDALDRDTVLVVYRLDRLARDLIVQEQILADAWRTGASVAPCSPTERIYCKPDHPDDPARTLIRQMLGAVAAYERAMIRLRMTRGRRRRLAEHGYAGGPEPYGYSDETELACLAHVTILRAAGHTWREVAETLNHAGTMKRNGGRWTAAEIHRCWHRHQTRTTEQAQPALL